VFFPIMPLRWRIIARPSIKPTRRSETGIKKAADAIDDAELSETRIKQREYWAALNPVLTAAGGPIAGNRKPQPQSWMAYSIGRSNFNLAAAMNRLKNQIRAELYIAGDQAKAFFGLLKSQKEEIERELGYSLEWEELPSRRDCRISSQLNDVDPENDADWPRQHAWLAQRLNDMHRVFARRVSALDADAWHPEGA
jgi:hypothetical protein